MALIDRREFLRRTGKIAFAAGALAVAGEVTGCSTTAPRRVSPRPTKPRTRPSWDELSNALSGRLVRPGDASYDNSRLVYDLRYADRYPKAVAYCATPTDVQRCVLFAKERDIVPIPRSGGHSFGGYSTGNGLVIDVTEMNSVTFDPNDQSMRVGSGTLLIDLYAQCASAGALVPGGSCPTVGISGLALGGGAGVLGRRYGLTCDNLRSLDIVTADGRQRHCDAETNADLFWASRGGGGGNFGVVTSFTFDTHPIPDLALFTLEWSFDSADVVLLGWQEWMKTAPRELWSNCQLLSQGTEGTAVKSSGVYVGPVDRLQRLVADLVSRTSEPTYEFVGADSYLHTMLVEAGCDGLTIGQCHLSGQTPSGTLSRSMFNAKSAYVSRAMSTTAVSVATGTIASIQESDQSVGAALIFDAYGGAINDVEPEKSAFVHRRALFDIEMSMAFSPDADPDTIESKSAWLQECAADLSPFCDGEAYQNYIDPNLSDWAHAYYGSNLERLSKVKRAYDPDNTFHFAQSIPLAQTS